MNHSPTPFNRQTLRIFARAVRDFLTSDVKRKAIGLLVLLLVFALSVNGLNVVNSYVGRDFMTAIAHRDMNDFIKLAIAYVAVFATTTAVAVFYRFIEERLGLLWRSSLTKRVTLRYLEERTYYHLKEFGAIDNVDQRMADDIRAFTATTLSFTLIFLNATLAVLSFSGVLWTISTLLFAVAVGYAALGTLLSIYFGRPLVGLNYRQSDREADFRANLIHVRENAESIAVLRREGRLKARLLRRIQELIENAMKISIVNRNLSFFTTGYNYLIQIIPTLIVAPSFIRGEIEFGVITQSTMAFAQLVGAFSLIVNQIGAISSFAAVVARLGDLAGAVESTDIKTSAIATIEDPSRLAYEQLTLRSPQDESILLAGLSANIPNGTRVLVTGPNESARVALFRATAGIWPSGEGRIIRPPLDSVLFLPQRPYLSPGTLRETLLRTALDKEISTEKIEAALHEAGLESVLHRAGGLDVEIDWATKLSLSEQQQLALIRLFLARPTLVLLDRASTAFGKAVMRQSLQRLAAHAISYLTFDESLDTIDLHDAYLEIHDDGSWHWPHPISAHPAAGESIKEQVLEDRLKP